MLATPQSAAVIAGCDRTSNDEEKRSLIHSLPTSPATLATPQSAAAIAGCDRVWHEVSMRSLIHSLPTYPATLATPQSAAVIAVCDRLRPILDTEIATTVRRQTPLDF